MESVIDNCEQFSEEDAPWPDAEAVQQKVEEVTTSIWEATDESTLSEKVDTLRHSLDDLSQEVHSWRGKSYYLEAIDDLKQQVDGIQQEWNAVGETLRIQRERMESLLQAFPGVIETSILKALSMRLKHLEEVVNDIIHERQNKVASERSKKQLTISIAAFIVSICSLGFFILMRFVSS